MTEKYKVSPQWQQEVKDNLRGSIPDGSYAAYLTPVYVGGKVTAFVGDTATANISLTDLTGGVAASPSANDIVIISYGVSSTTNINVDVTGYTELEDLYADDTYDANLGVYWKKMGSTPDTQFTRSSTGSVDNAGAVAVHVWRNIDTITPIDVTTANSTGTNGVIADPPSITPVTPGAIIIVSGFGAHIRGNSVTFGASYASNFLSAGQDDVNDSTIGMGSVTWPGGAYNPAAFTFSSTTATTYSWAAVTLALRPQSISTANSDYSSGFTKNVKKSITSRKLYSNDIASTYSMVYTVASAYTGNVLAPNGDIHFIPYSAIVGQKISAAGVVSTYSLTYTTTTAYAGGVLAPNGDIHFVPYSATVGQKVSAAGVVSTYSLAYSVATAYSGGVLGINGEIYFIPRSAAVLQRISSAGVVSSYSLVYTVASAYAGGVLALNGDVHFIPYSATVGQKISATGVISTYSLVYTVATAYNGAILAANGDIHFVPYSATVGQKISPAGVVSTYSLTYTTTTAYAGGVLAPNGDIHFVPYSGSVGQKVSATEIITTYSLSYTTTTAYAGGVLAPNGDIIFAPLSGTVGQKISTLSARPFSQSFAQSSFFNKY